MIVLGLGAILLGLAQTIIHLDHGNGVWLHLEPGGPGTIMGGIILVALGWYLRRSEK